MARKLVLGTVRAVLIAGPAFAACEGSAQWLWSANSDLVNRSTQALAAGHSSQAKNLAESALASRLPATDTLIASSSISCARERGGEIGKGCAWSVTMVMSVMDTEVLMKLMSPSPWCDPY